VQDRWTARLAVVTALETLGVALGVSLLAWALVCLSGYVAGPS